MGDRKEWSKCDTEELINMYHAKPELWDVTSKSYRNRVKKQDALKKMAEECSTTTEEVRRKIHNLRNQFNNECKKIRKPKSGQGTDELQFSKWPYYNLLLFLQGGSVCRLTIGNLPMDSVVVEAANEKNTSCDNQGTSFEQSDLEENHSDLAPILLEKGINPNKKRKTQNLNNDLLLQKAIQTLNEEEDQYDIFGKYVASKMRNTSSEYLRKKMKRKLQQVILEINGEDELLANPDSRIDRNPNSVDLVHLDSIITLM